ncbi:hypothetical protein O3251_002969 [Salmonella enterica]|nr:hypothetical protein [Salmonella enterica]
MTIGFFLRKIISLPFVFICIYTTFFLYILIKAPDIYNAVFFVYYSGVPSSILYVFFDAYFSLPTHGNIYFDVAIMYLLGVIQYGVIGWICQKIFQAGCFVIKKYFLHK